MIISGCYNLTSNKATIIALVFFAGVSVFWSYETMYYLHWDIINGLSFFSGGLSDPALKFYH